MGVRHSLRFASTCLIWYYMPCGGGHSSGRCMSCGGCGGSCGNCERGGEKKLKG